jgi:hypothetical protein
MFSTFSHRKTIFGCVHHTNELWFVFTVKTKKTLRTLIQKIQKLPVGTIDETMPLESLNVVLNVPRKVPPHPPDHHICPPDLAKPLLSTMTPAPDVVPTKPSALASDMVTASSLVPVLDFLPSMTPAFDLVEPVTGSETTKTPKANDMVLTKTSAPDLLPTMTPASDLVEPVTSSETTVS